MQTERVVICAIGYRVQVADVATVIFTEECPIGGRPTRFMLSRRDEFALWSFEPCEGWGNVPCAHIVKAYEWVKTKVCGDHDPLPKSLESQQADQKGGTP